MKYTDIPKYAKLLGIISNLSTEATHVHYLKNIKQQQQMAGAAAVIQAATEHAGVVFSAQAALDEGDPVEGFTMQVSGKQVQGSFWRSTFKEGDEVQVIGEERYGTFNAVALTIPMQRMIWMQPHCERGTIAKRKIVFQACVWVVLFAYLVTMLLSIFSELPAWFLFLGMTITLPLLLFVTVGLSWRDFMTFAREMNAVGTALNLPEPENIDLFKSTKAAIKAGKPDVPMGVYYY